MAGHPRCGTRVPSVGSGDHTRTSAPPIQATGTAENNHTLRANNIVVLTGYVHVQTGTAS
jgi:hypothetical protein